MPTEDVAAAVRRKLGVRNYLVKPVQRSVLLTAVRAAVAAIAAAAGAEGMKAMGRVVAAVRAKAGPTADGAKIAAMVKAALAG